MGRINGNRNWSNGRPPEVRPAMPTEFEGVVRMLELSETSYVSSEQLRTWCEVNRNHKYVPEWLLSAWELRVNTDHGLS